MSLITFCKIPSNWDVVDHPYQVDFLTHQTPCKIKFYVIIKIQSMALIWFLMYELMKAKHIKFL